MSVGSDLYRQGDPCSTYYIVLSGWIALSVLLDDGSCQILDFALPGAVLGFQSGPDAPMYHSARCLSVVRVYASRGVSWIRSWKAIRVLLLCSATRSLPMRPVPMITSPISGCEVQGSASPASSRDLCEVRRRLPAEPGEIIQLPLSQVHIGQALGLTYVHVCRTLQNFAKKRLSASPTTGWKSSIPQPS